MKKLLLLFVFLVHFYNSNAQSAYIPFPTNMIIYGWTQTDITSGSTYHSYRTEIVDDTIIGAYTYQKLYSGTGPYTVTAATRNDVLNKKVYLYSVSTGTEKLLYDFNLAVGDTVNSSNGYGFYQPLLEGAVSGTSFTIVDTAWVTSIDSILMPHDGLYHRRFNFSGKVKNIIPDSADVIISTSNPGPYYYSSVAGASTLNMTMEPLIEGVGQLYNPVSHYFYFEYQWHYTVSCASINDAAVVTLGSFNPPFIYANLCNSLLTGVEEVAASENVLLYPNPTNGLLHLETTQPINSIEITNVLGKQLYSATKNNIQTELNISNFINGVYFIRLTDLKGNTVVKKIIKN
jgi:Secretion system C-terminal sorting domain